jgi:LacI family transcriptional regulator
VSAPPLTTIAVDPRARGRQAAELILRRLRDPDAPPCTTVAAVHLQPRASSEAPRAPGMGVNGMGVNGTAVTP